MKTDFYAYDSTKEPEIGHALKKTDLPETCAVNNFEYCWENSPYRIVVGNNPVNYTDPMGLVMVSSNENGNVWPGFDDQDQVCSWPMGVLKRGSSAKSVV